MPLIGIEVQLGEDESHPVIGKTAIGDLDGDQAVTGNDLALLTLDVNSGSADPDESDIDGNGVVDVVDIVALVDNVGTERDLAVADDLIDLILTGEDLVESEGWEGTQIPQAEQPAVMGFIGCAWCMWRCGAGLFAASECIDDATEQVDQCIDDSYGDGDPFSIVECYEMRNQLILNCLDQIAQNIPGCQKCVIKCAPAPTP